MDECLFHRTILLSTPPRADVLLAQPEGQLAAVCGGNGAKRSGNQWRRCRKRVRELLKLGSRRTVPSIRR
jgi:hypothetical protein